MQDSHEYDWIPETLASLMVAPFGSPADVDAFRAAYPGAASDEYFDLLRGLVAVRADAGLLDGAQSVMGMESPACEQDALPPLFGSIWTTRPVSHAAGWLARLAPWQPMVLITDLAVHPDEGDIPSLLQAVTLGIYAPGPLQPDEWLLEESQAHASFTLQLWHENPVAQESLYRCVGVLTPAECEKLAAYVLRKAPVVAPISLPPVLALHRELTEVQSLPLREAAIEAIEARHAPARVFDFEAMLAEAQQISDGRIFVLRNEVASTCLMAAADSGVAVVPLLCWNGPMEELFAGAVNDADHDPRRYDAEAHLALPFRLASGGDTLPLQFSVPAAHADKATPGSPVLLCSASSNQCMAVGSVSRMGGAITIARVLPTLRDAICSTEDLLLIALLADAP